MGPAIQRQPQGFEMHETLLDCVSGPLEFHRDTTLQSKQHQNGHSGKIGRMKVLDQPISKVWRRPEVLLLLMAAASPISFATWMALIDNFSIHEASFTGKEIGILQSLREVPGFASFAVVWVLLVMREQKLAYLSLLCLGVGTAVTGFFPNVLGLYITTVVMSLGFHYYETVASSLALQWFDKDKAPELLGKVIAVSSAASIVAFGLIWIGFEQLEVGYTWTYLIGGGATIAIALFCWLGFPHYPEKVQQNKHMVLRKRYWLYYVLTFLSGARRQIFIVFAGFLLVEKFDYDVGAVAALYLLNAAINIPAAPAIGRMIARFGERNALIVEYIGLIGVFTAYALVDNGTVAGILYVLDHLFFAMAIAMRTYFQKIADPADIASTAGVSFTINHVAAVVLPALYGVLWLASPALVFLSGAALALASLICALMVPHDPQPGNEVMGWGPHERAVPTRP